MVAPGVAANADPPRLTWRPLPPLPDRLGVAGPFVGTHHGALVVAGGANFPVTAGEDRWSVAKQWHAGVWVLPAPSVADGAGDTKAWEGMPPLQRPVAYGAVASTTHGIVCIGGEDGTAAVTAVTLLAWDAVERRLRARALPPLPRPLAFAAAAALCDVVYLAGGQHGTDAGTATDDFLRLDLAALDSPASRDGAAAPLAWERLPRIPSGPRAFPVVVARPTAAGGAIHVMSGRRLSVGGPPGAIEALLDHVEFDPARYAVDAASGFRSRADLPHAAMAGTGVAAGPSRVVVVSGDDGTLWERGATLRDAHPGFQPFALLYDTDLDRWDTLTPPPVNQLATPALPVAGGFVLISGEVRPRHRSPRAWHVTIHAADD